MTRKHANKENIEEEEKTIIRDLHGMKATYFHKRLHNSLHNILYRKRPTEIFKILKSLMSAFHVLISIH